MKVVYKLNKGKRKYNEEIKVTVKQEKIAWKYVSLTDQNIHTNIKSRNRKKETAGTATKKLEGIWKEIT